MRKEAPFFLLLAGLICSLSMGRNSKRFFESW